MKVKLGQTMVNVLKTDCRSCPIFVNKCEQNVSNFIALICMFSRHIQEKFSLNFLTRHQPKDVYDRRVE